MKWINVGFAAALLVSVSLTGCGIDLGDLIDQLPTPSSTPTPIPVESSAPTHTPLPTLTPRPIATITPTPSPTGSPDEGGKKPCVGSFVSTKPGYMDGPLKFLWKNGDTTKKLAVIIDCAYTQPDRVTVYGPKGKAENLSYAGTGNPGTCGPRWHYRGSKPTTAYSGKVEVFTGDKVCVYSFKNSSRVD